MSIVPTDTAPPLVPSAVASLPSTPTNTQPMIDQITFNQVDITELLSMISTQFNVPIAVEGDLTGKIGLINLQNVTAEQAINTVTRVAGLSCQKSAEGIFIITKKAPAPLVAPVQATEVQSFVSPLPPITPNSG